MIPSSKRSLSQILSCTSHIKDISEHDSSEKVCAHSLIEFQSVRESIVLCTKVTVQSLVKGHTSLHQ